MPLSSDIKAILFDLDGTLIEVPSLWSYFDDILVELLKQYQIPVPPLEERLDVWHSGGNFEGIIRGWGVLSYDEFIELFIDKDLEKRREYVEEGRVCVYSDVSVLDALRQHVRLGLVTNTPPRIANFELDVFQLRRHFDSLVILGQVEQHIAKPEPDGFLRCLSQLHVAPANAIMVGDSSSDIIGGHRAGVGTVLVRRPNQPTPRDLPVEPDLIIDSFHELLCLVELIPHDD
ncbi:MAG: HAD family hydrolase [Promethearchaeota archaeon]